MSEYKGFIPLDKYIELKNELCKIADIRGLENKLHHLHQPDTDMNDKVCENFEVSKISILIDITQMIDKLHKFSLKMIELEER